jgi:hypothetical protein
VPEVHDLRQHERVQLRNHDAQTMNGSTSNNPLKRENRWCLFAGLAANLILFDAAVTYGSLRFDDIRSVAAEWSQVWHQLGFATLAFGAITLLNGLLSPDAKARLVFWRWQHPLPGCRAFSLYLRRDPRVDVPALVQRFSTLPTEPASQNALWYRIYRDQHDCPAIRQAHRDFLFSRDYSGLSALFVIFLGLPSTVIVEAPSTVFAYLTFLVSQYLVASWSARNYGIRLVTSAVSNWQAQPLSARSPKTTLRSSR